MSASKIVVRVVSISFSVLMFILVIYVLYQSGLYAYRYGYRVFAEPAMTVGEGQDKLVQIRPSMNALEIGEVLEQKGLIRDKWLFAVQAKLSGYDKSIEPDYYTLNTSMTTREMLKAMSKEDTQQDEEEAEE